MHQKITDALLSCLVLVLGLSSPDIPICPPALFLEGHGKDVGLSQVGSGLSSLNSRGPHRGDRVGSVEEVWVCHAVTQEGGFCQPRHVRAKSVSYFQ